MPELPEAETTRRKLFPLLKKRIKRFSTNWPRGLRVLGVKKVEPDIVGRKVLALRRHGKAIFLDLSSKTGNSGIERVLAFHQRMSGRLIIEESRIKNLESRIDEKHVHNKLFFKDGTELWFSDARKFGVVWYGTPEAVAGDSYIGALGPDALDISFADFKKQLDGKTGIAKAVLLRQDVMAGIGNIIADEMLWEAKVHPRRSLATLTLKQRHTLHASLQKILARGIKAQGTSIRNWGHPDGTSGKFQKYFKVYDRAGEPCVRCKTPIQRIVVAGRGTWVCGKCQKA